MTSIDLAQYPDIGPNIANAGLDQSKRLLEIQLNDCGHEKLKTVTCHDFCSGVRQALASKTETDCTIKFVIAQEHDLDFIQGDHWPVLLSLYRTGTSAELNLWVQRKLTWFRGHFPRHPVLAGVVQTHWVCEIAQHLFAINAQFREIENLKFQRIIEPQTQLLLSLDYSSEKQRVIFRYSANDGDYSKGRIRFAP